MGMREETEKIDLFGLPVYKTTKIKKERIGDEIHLICGYEMQGQTVWTHIEIWTAADLMTEANNCLQLSMRPRKQLAGAPATH